MHPNLIRTFIAVSLLMLLGQNAWAQNMDPDKYKARYVQQGTPEVSEAEQICFALYTVNNKVLKLSAQLYPLKDSQTRQVYLQIMQNGKWTEIAQTEVVTPGWVAPFRVVNWDMSRTVRYRVAHGSKAFYTGTIQKDPKAKDVIVVAGFTGNSVARSHGGDLPKSDIVENIKKIKPDLLFFSGDQVYNHSQHLRFWLQFGRDFGDIIRDIPTVTIPDDHDAGQANLWGAGGKQCSTQAGDDGGYFAPPWYVNMVQLQQTSHLPDPYDPAPIDRGIGVYYTALNVGGISFAIIEDRKFKSGPNGLVPKQGPRPDHIRNPDYDPKSVDVPGAVLLGKRQLSFIRDWAQDWTGAQMKCVLSQTIFCGGAHVHGKVGGRLHADMDSNGWPQSGRNRALHEFRKAFAFMYAGDQHLATIFHHGIDDFGDAGYSFCVPSIANLYLRWWDPLEPGKNRLPGASAYTGEHLDGFHNKLTVYAAANPDKRPANGDKLTTRAAGFGVVKFNKQKRTITMECWPRNVDISAPGAKPYPDWPKTINQGDNYGRKAVAYLPTLRILGQVDPVVQIVKEPAQEVVYTLRIKGNGLRPKVFEQGSYTIRVGEGDNVKVLRGIRSIGADISQSLQIEF